jgi:hypothetical protein
MDIWESGSIAPCILDVDNGEFTTWSPNPLEKCCRYALDINWMDSRTGLNALVKRRASCVLTGIENRFFGVQPLATLQTEIRHWHVIESWILKHVLCICIGKYFQPTVRRKYLWNRKCCLSWLKLVTLCHVTSQCLEHIQRDDTCHSWPTFSCTLPFLPYFNLGMFHLFTCFRQCIPLSFSYLSPRKKHLNRVWAVLSSKLCLG